MATRPNLKGRMDAPGGFAGVPRVVMDSHDYIELSYKSRVLLFDLAYQYRGNNNGNLTCAFSILKYRGWKREATISAAVDELIRAHLILRTREGRFANPGARCALYALTWQRVDECPSADLDHPPTIRPIRQFSLEGKHINKMPITECVSVGPSMSGHVRGISDAFSK